MPRGVGVGIERMERMPFAALFFRCGVFGENHEFLAAAASRRFESAPSDNRRSGRARRARLAGPLALSRKRRKKPIFDRDLTANSGGGKILFPRPERLSKKRTVWAGMPRTPFARRTAGALFRQRCPTAALRPRRQRAMRKAVRRRPSFFAEERTPRRAANSKPHSAARGRRGAVRIRFAILLGELGSWARKSRGARDRRHFA